METKGKAKEADNEKNQEYGPSICTKDGLFYGLHPSDISAIIDQGLRKEKFSISEKAVSGIVETFKKMLASPDKESITVPLLDGLCNFLTLPHVSEQHLDQVAFRDCFMVSSSWTFRICRGKLLYIANMM